MKKNNKILVTGGMGYIGSHVAVDLIQNGYEVVSIDNLINSGEWVIDAMEKITGKRIQNYPVDIRNGEALKEVFQKEKDIDAVIHFAALKAVGESVENPMKYFDYNVSGLISLLENLPETIKTFVFSSSCTVYGAPDHIPVDENHPMGHTESPYGTSKKISEMILTDLVAYKKNMNLVLLRYFNPAGAHESGLMGEKAKYQVTNLVPVIMETATGKREFMQVFGDDYDTRDGSAIRDYIHIMDLAEAHTKAMKYGTDLPFGKYEIFNLGSENGISVFEAISAFEKTVKKEVNYKVGPRREGDVPMIYADSTRAKEKLNWSAKRGIEEIMQSAWKWETKVMAEAEKRQLFKD